MSKPYIIMYLHLRNCLPLRFLILDHPDTPRFTTNARFTYFTLMDAARRCCQHKGLLVGLGQGGTCRFSREGEREREREWERERMRKREKERERKNVGLGLQSTVEFIWIRRATSRLMALRIQQRSLHSTPNTALAVRQSYLGVTPVIVLRPSDARFDLTVCI